MPTISVIGSLNTDLVSRVTRTPNGGETLITKSFNTGSGGKGANQAVACARLSRRKGTLDGLVSVDMFGAVGDDSFGKDLKRDLGNNCVFAEGVVEKKGEKSGVAIIIVEEESGENRILMSPNANYSLKPEGFLELSKRSGSYADLIVLQLEIPLDTTLQILKTAYERKIEVLLNPAPAQKLPKEAYKAVTHLIVNESEAAIITGNGGKSIEWAQECPERQMIRALGVPHVIITLGARGVCLMTHERGEVIEGQKTKVKDTTAAGDTFVGAYAVAITTNQRDRSFTALRAAVDWANKAAAKAVEKEGAQASIPWLDDVPPKP